MRVQACQTLGEWLSRVTENSKDGSLMRTEELSERPGAPGAPSGR